MILERHLNQLQHALEAASDDLLVAAQWGRRLAQVLPGGARLLVTGNGGSAAQAQHLSAELVGRYVNERHPVSVIALPAEPSSMTAIANDYGVEQVYARQVRAHGRPGDVCLILSTAGRSPNVIAAAEAAQTGTIHGVHLVALHVLCEEFDAALLSPQRVSEASH